MLNISLSFKRLSFYEKCYKVILVLLITMTSGFPLLINNNMINTAVLLYATAGILYFKPNIEWAIRFCTFFFLLNALQTAYFGEFYITTALNQEMLFCSAAFSISILGTTFIFIFKKIMVFIAGMASVLFIPILINFNFYNILYSLSPFKAVTIANIEGWEPTSYNIFVMNFPPDFFEGLIRNSGPFWEPGSFGGYLIIALIFNTLIHNTLWRKDNIILTIAILTTFSTTTYLAFAAFTMGYSFLMLKNVALRWILLSILIIGSIIAFNKIEFLGKKIDTEFKEAQYNALEKGGDTRAASALLDLKEIQESPLYILFGRGSHPYTRIGGSDKEALRTNGVTDLLSRYGLFFFIFTVIYLWKSFNLICKLGNTPTSMAYLSVIVIFIISFSEVYFIFVFFKALTLFGMTAVQNKIIICRFREQEEYKIKPSSLVKIS